MGGTMNYIILASTFFIGFMMWNKNYSFGFVNSMIGVLPLLGLTGTVVGMIETFNALMHTGTDINSLSAGISKAMITTSSGLAISFLALCLIAPRGGEELNKTIDLQRELCDNIRSEREKEKEEICTLS
tara:strand:+ start:647 stop:1033 length:387 start_codon:yes stop_codon:yes gene_type:complete